RWVEASRVPALAAIFANKEQGIPLPEMPELATASQATVTTTVTQPVTEQIEEQARVVHSVPNAKAAATTFSADDISSTCKRHADAPAYVVCEGCESSWCKGCPNSYGGSVKICPDCGSLCSPVKQAATAKRSTAAREHALAAGFGFSDFGEAIAYPFKFNFSLIVGGIMFTVFSLGQSAGALGGIFLMGAALFC